MSRKVKSLEEQYVRGSVMLQKVFRIGDIEVMKRMPVATFMVLNEELRDITEEGKEQAKMNTKSGGKSVPRTLRS